MWFEPRHHESRSFRQLWFRWRRSTTCFCSATLFARESRGALEGFGANLETDCEALGIAVHNDRPQRRYPGLLAKSERPRAATFRLIQAAAGFSLIASALTTGVDERYLIAAVIKIPQYISIVGLRITWYGADLRRLSHSHSHI
jgi:hypothetical protein